MNTLEFTPIYQEGFRPDLFDWSDKTGESTKCGQCDGTGQDPRNPHQGCSGCRGLRYIDGAAYQVCEAVNAGEATVEAWYCEDLRRVIIRGKAPICLEEEREDGQDLTARAFRVSGLTAAGLVVRAADTKAQAIRKAVDYTDRYRKAWEDISPAPASMKGQERAQELEEEPEPTKGPTLPDEPPELLSGAAEAITPPQEPPEDLAAALEFCLGQDTVLPAGFVNDHSDLLLFGDAREDGDREQADAHYKRLRESLMVTHADHDQARDMLEDARTLLGTVGDALQVPHEPHQSYRERLIETAQDITDADQQLKQAMAAAAMPPAQLIDRVMAGRLQEIPAWVAELVRSVYQSASEAVHRNHAMLYQRDGSTVSYDLSPAEHEQQIRDKLESMGWMPPGQAREAMENPPSFQLGEFSNCGPDNPEDFEGRIVYNPGDPESGIPGTWQLVGTCPLADYIRGLELRAEAGALAFDILRPSYRLGEERPVAPWPDIHGRPIHEGDTIRHPSGQEGLVIYRPEREEDADRWLVDYGDGAESRLVLQVNDRGQGVAVQP